MAGKKKDGDQKSATPEPIAIIGMAFRLPGDLCDEASFWDALKEGRDLVSQVGPERWATEDLQHPRRSEPGRAITFSAGVLSRVEEFDAGFFGISPREAAWLDPQQRLLLELAWEAMENGGQIPSHLAGTDCSVHVGISSLDYGLRGTADLAGASMHSMTGNTMSIAANRLSFAFDLRGPSMAVDTACSSSFVALHQACNSLRKGESSVALAGSVNLLLHPYAFICFTKASMISAGGRCRTFDASADGYVRAEGGAVLVLKPLSQAEKDGDPIHAVILGSGVNADGGRKSGLTIPSAAGQIELMRSVLASTGIEPGQVDYIEAHGTGTPVGDPIEAKAIGEVYGGGREQPLPIGSVKTNLGHLEAASGFAGLIKTVCMLKRQAVPPSLHFVTPNPHIPFSDLNLRVVTDYTALQKRGGRPPVMGVNSFGFGGTNAHVLLQAHHPVRIAANTSDMPAPPLFLSARMPEALQEMAGRYAAFLRSPEAPPYYDIAYSAAFRRQHLECRLALTAANSPDAAAQLERFAQEGILPDAVTENLLPQPGSVAFVYSGNGAQWAGMGKRLMAESLRFADIMQELDRAMAPRAGFSLLAELGADEAASRLADTAVAQPLLFAMQVAITRLLRERGVAPEAVAGHSVGEVSAAWASGALSLDQAIDVICARSAEQARTQGSGRMAAVGLSEEAARESLREGGHDGIEIAGVNGPSSVTLAGPLEQLEALQKTLEAKKIFFRLLDLDYAFHSRAMEGIRAGLGQRLGIMTPEKSAIPFVSTVAGKVIDGRLLTARYWWDNVRQPVRFADGIATLIGLGCRVFIEIGPHAVLQRYVMECLSAAQTAGRVLATLRRDDDGAQRIEEAALRAHLSLAEPVLNAYFPSAAPFVRLPGYPWQRETYRYRDTSESVSRIERPRVHPLLGLRLAECEAAWENTLDPMEYPYLADHRVGGAIVLPATAYVEMALAASREWFGGEGFEFEELDILSPVVFDGDQARALRFEFSPREGAFRILGRQRLSEGAWALHAVGRLLGAPTRPAPPMEPAAGAEGLEVDAAVHYALTRRVGLDYGPAFRGFAGGTIRGDVLDGRLELPEEMDENSSRYMLHPALLDACFQSLIDFFRADIESGRGLPLLPAKVGRLRYFGGTPGNRFRMRLKKRGSRSIQADFTLLNEEGQVVYLLEGCRFRAAPLQHILETEPARWRIDARLAPHPADNSPAIAGNAALAQQAGARLSAAKIPLQRQKYYGEGLSLLNALVVAFAYAAFGELDARHGIWLQHALNAPEAVPGDRRAYFRWLARLLQEAELLTEAEGAWRLDRAKAPPPAEDIWRALIVDFPDAISELLFAGRVGLRLAELIGGELAVPDLRQALRGSHFSETYFRDVLPYQEINLALKEVLRAIGDAWPANRRLRILEVSGGLTDLPHRLSAHLPAGKVDYVVAEADGERLARLDAEYQAHPFVKVARLGDDLTLTSDTALPDSFDVVIVYHWLHRSPRAAAILAGLRRTLAAGGRLLLAERHSSPVADFVFGIDEAWWREPAQASGPPVSSLLEPAAWTALLKTHGFEDVEKMPEPLGEGTQGGSYLLLARNPAAASALPEPASAAWLLISESPPDDSNLEQRLTRDLMSRGQRVALAQMEDAGSVRGMLVAARERLGALDHIVYFGGAADTGIGGAPAAPQDISHMPCVSAAHLVQALEGGQLGQPRLWLVTSGGALVTEAGESWKVSPLEAPLWGLGRVVMNECPELSCTLIDLAFDLDSDRTVERLRTELLHPDGESEIVLSPDARFGLRMRRDSRAAGDGAGTGAANRFRLDFLLPGQLRNLVWLGEPERALADDEIEVRTAAAGLNFRDIMYAMGLLPDEAVENGFAGASLGLEFSGTISRLGSKVTEYRVGDDVLGFAGSCFSSHVVTKAAAVVRKPEAWSFAQAATVPTAFFTVYYALKHLANLQPGERVLVHGGAGGVGIAAIQIAAHLGAEVFVTAGSEEKRDFVRLLGADHVLDSRSLAFADDVLALTGGEGVDVVLNSLAGEAINRNLRVLKPFGRFLELGKRDFYENTHIGLRPFKDNISYFGIDADQLLLARPQLAGSLFREMMEFFGQGAFVPLPYRCFPADRAVEAFRFMQQSRHIGKVVIDLAQAEVTVANRQENLPPLGFRKDSSYLVTGGLDGFGLESACWLAEHGAGHLVLLGRRGAGTPGAAEAVARLEALGARVHIFACDVADRASLEAVLGRISAGLPPLRGILHAAAVIDDGLLSNLDGERFRKVLAPKILGAWNLHSLSLGLPLDYFILYSSISTYIGNPGQANYVAANAYLEALAGSRRRQGQPATCINWGPIGDSGYLTRNQAVKDSLTARFGAKPLEVRRALSSLESILREDTSHVVVADFEWRTLGRLLASAGVSRFQALREAAARSGEGADNSADIMDLIAGKPVEEVCQIVQSLIVAEVANILCVSRERIDPARSLQQLGMDSLMAVELALSIERRLGIQLPPMALKEGSNNIERISARLAEKLAGPRQEVATDRIASLVAEIAAQHVGDTVSAEEISETIDDVRRAAQAGAGGAE